MDVVTVEEKGIADVDGVAFRRVLEAIELETTGREAKRNDACFDVVHDEVLAAVTFSPMDGDCAIEHPQ